MLVSNFSLLRQTRWCPGGVGRAQARVSCNRSLSHGNSLPVCPVTRHRRTSQNWQKYVSRTDSTDSFFVGCCHQQHKRMLVSRSYPQSFSRENSDRTFCGSVFALENVQSDGQKPLILQLTELNGHRKQYVFILSHPFIFLSILSFIRTNSCYELWQNMAKHTSRLRTG